MFINPKETSHDWSSVVKVVTIGLTLVLLCVHLPVAYGKHNFHKNFVSLNFAFVLEFNLNSANYTKQNISALDNMVKSVHATHFS